MFKNVRLINLSSGLTKNLAASLSLAILFSASGQSVLANDSSDPKTNDVTKQNVVKKIDKKNINSLDCIMVQLNSGADRDNFDSLLKEVNGNVVDTISMGPMQILVVEAEHGKVSETEKKLKGSKDVKTVEVNRKYRVNQAPNDAYYSFQFDLGMMKYSQARQIGQNYNGVSNMYFLDTGINPIAGEYAPIIKQYNFSRPWQSSGELERPHDSGTHGTATASVAADTNNGMGLAGMANFSGNRVALVECRITPDGEYSEGLSIIYALAFIYNQLALHNFGPGPVNLSFGSTPPNSLNAAGIIQGCAQLLLSQGSILVLAAGNDGIEDPSPELYARRVAAVGSDFNLATFSEFGPFQAAAPGVQVPVYNVAAGSIPEAVVESGTSFSAPRWCAAIAAVMAALPPGKNTAAIADSIVFNTATVTAAGWHVPNLQAALKAATSR
jgi:hypothetical protein